MSSQQHEAAATQQATPAAPNNLHLEKPLNNGYLQANVPLEDLSATVVSPLLGQQQVPHQVQQQQQQPQQQQNKLPTVVFLAPDGSGGVGIQRGNPSQGNPGGGSAGVAGHSDWLLKESQQRRRLLVLAIAFTVLGAAIGALAIYFASVHQRCQLYRLEPGKDYVLGQQLFLRLSFSVIYL